ncbi:homocysteine methyltransferase, partial [Paenibacillus darwinianus]
MKPDLRQALRSSLLTGDGAMGTYLYQQGFPVGVSYEEFNMIRPDVIESVHRRYYEAGARVIETNTFSANAEKLAKYGLESEVERINREGVRIARGAVGADAYVVGAVGSVRGGRRKNVRTAQVTKAFEQQIGILLDSGVDGLLLETFYDLDELLLALSVVRSMSAGVSVICQLSAPDSGATQDGIALADAFGRLESAGADAVGFNCVNGPNGILRAIDNIGAPVGLPLSVFPNAGTPDYVDGRYTYTAGPDYFGETARRFADRGARLIGGCCGTTPEHVAAIAAALAGYSPQPAEAGQVTDGSSAAIIAPAAVAPAVPAGSAAPQTGA